MAIITISKSMLLTAALLSLVILLGCNKTKEIKTNIEAPKEHYAVFDTGPGIVYISNNKDLLGYLSTFLNDMPQPIYNSIKYYLDNNAGNTELIQLLEKPGKELTPIEHANYCLILFFITNDKISRLDQLFAAVDEYPYNDSGISIGVMLSIWLDGHQFSDLADYFILKSKDSNPKYKICANLALGVFYTNPDVLNQLISELSRDEDFVKWSALISLNNIVENNPDVNTVLIRDSLRNVINNGNWMVKEQVESLLSLLEFREKYN